MLPGRRSYVQLRRTQTASHAPDAARRDGGGVFCHGAFARRSWRGIDEFPGRPLRPEERRAMQAYYTARYGLDRPVIVQYFNWLNHVSPIGIKKKDEGFPNGWRIGFKAVDLGEAFSTHRPVSTMIAESVPITLLLETLSLPLVYGIAIWTGIRGARSRGKLVDVGLGFTLIGLYSLPSIWVGVLMIGFLSNVEYVHWFPTNGLHDLMSDSMTFLPTTIRGHFERGWLLDMIWHLCMPLICLSYGAFAFLSRLHAAPFSNRLARIMSERPAPRGFPKGWLCIAMPFATA